MTTNIIQKNEINTMILFYFFMMIYGNPIPTLIGPGPYGLPYFS